MADATPVDKRFNKTGGCDTCANRIICKQITEMTQVETELLTTLGKHTTLETLQIGMVCDRYTIPKEATT